MRVVVCENKHAINMTNKLINTVARHTLRVSAAEIDAILACKVGTAGFIEEGVIVHLAIVGLKEIGG